MLYKFSLKLKFFDYTNFLISLRYCTFILIVCINKTEKLKLDIELD